MQKGRPCEVSTTEAYHVLRAVDRNQTLAEKYPARCRRRGKERGVLHALSRVQVASLTSALLAHGSHKAGAT